MNYPLPSNKETGTHTSNREITIQRAPKYVIPTHLLTHKEVELCSICILQGIVRVPPEMLCNHHNIRPFDSWGKITFHFLHIELRKALLMKLKTQGLTKG